MGVDFIYGPNSFHHRKFFIILQFYSPVLNDVYAPPSPHTHPLKKDHPMIYDFIACLDDLKNVYKFLQRKSYLKINPNAFYMFKNKVDEMRIVKCF